MKIKGNTILPKIKFHWLEMLSLSSSCCWSYCKDMVMVVVVESLGTIFWTSFLNFFSCSLLYPMMVCSITSANVSMTANIIQISKNVVLVVVGKLLEVLPNNVDKINRQLSNRWIFISRKLSEREIAILP